jgi:curved DNA-binding protein CbpA
MSTPEAELLKVSPEAGLDDLKRAYRKAALAHHPDQNPHPEAARHFRRLTEAYRVLEAKARLREPPKPRILPPAERVRHLLADVGSLVRRWPAERWNHVVDGLPAVVWVTSVLEVLTAKWPASSPPPSPQTNGGIAETAEVLAQRVAAFPVAKTLPRSQLRALEAALRAAEVRLRALDRPTRRRS